jgi:hypothetical protein
MRSDDRVRSHDTVIDRCKVHRAALAAHQPNVALHQFAENLSYRHAPRERMRVSAVGAERKVTGLHRAGEAGGDRFLTERQVALTRFCRNRSYARCSDSRITTCVRYKASRFSSPMSSLVTAGCAPGEFMALSR